MHFFRYERLILVRRLVVPVRGLDLAECANVAGTIRPMEIPHEQLVGFASARRNRIENLVRKQWSLIFQMANTRNNSISDPCFRMFDTAQIAQDDCR